MNERKVDAAAPYQTIGRAAALTGLPQSYLRRGCIEGRVPFIKSGRCYLVCVPELLRQLTSQTDSEKGGVEE